MRRRGFAIGTSPPLGNARRILRLPRPSSFSIPKSVNALLDKAGVSLDAIDLFVFHRANQNMLEHLRKRIKIPPEKFQISMAHCGNTVSSSIPIALKHAVAESRLKQGSIVMLVGFGVGYSWGATLLRWR